MRNYWERWKELNSRENYKKLAKMIGAVIAALAEIVFLFA